MYIKNEHKLLWCSTEQILSNWFLFHCWVDVCLTNSVPIYLFSRFSPSTVNSIFLQESVTENDFYGHHVIEVIPMEIVVL